MNVSLTPELEAMIQAKVASGLYNNASEVVREALRILVDRDREKELRVELLKRELSTGLEDLEKGAFGKRSLEEIRKNILEGQEADD